MNDDKPESTVAQGSETVQSGAQPAAAAQPAPKPEQPAQEDKPEELTAEELRLMADTMPGDGPGDD